MVQFVTQYVSISLPPKLYPVNMQFVISHVNEQLFVNNSLQQPTLMTVSIDLETVHNFHDVRTKGEDVRRGGRVSSYTDVRNRVIFELQSCHCVAVMSLSRANSVPPCSIDFNNPRPMSNSPWINQVSDATAAHVKSLV